MIFALSEKLIDSIKPNLLSDLVAEIIDHEHYIAVSGQASVKLMDAVAKNASTSQKEQLATYQGFLPSREIQTYCTTVSDMTFSYEALMEMARRPAIILMENTREWVVYRRMIECYAGDARFGNLYKILEGAAKNSARLLPVKSGGCSDMLQSLSDLSLGGYNNSLDQKVFVVFDRDTNSARIFDSNKKRLFIRLSGKKFSKISNADVYCLSQNGISWHMWYRRELENYFPDSVYVKCKFSRTAGLPPYEDDHYADVSVYYAPNKQAERRLKNSFALLSSYMTRELFEKNQQVFSIGGENIGEIELFLLKLVKII